jgi:hypothetical protein
MREGGGGVALARPRMIHTEPGHARVPRAFATGMGAYSGTKHAVEAISDAMRMELLPMGISVSLVKPGELTLRSTPSASEDSLFVCLFVSEDICLLYLFVCFLTLCCDEEDVFGLTRVVPTVLRRTSNRSDHLLVCFILTGSIKAAIWEKHFEYRNSTDEHEVDKQVASYVASARGSEETKALYRPLIVGAVNIVHQVAKHHTVGTHVTDAAIVGCCPPPPPTHTHTYTHPHTPTHTPTHHHHHHHHHHLSHLFFVLSSPFWLSSGHFLRLLT